MNTLGPLLASIIPQLPTLLVCAAGIAFALVNQSRYPRPSLFVLLAAGLYIATGVAQPVITQLLGQSYASGTGARPNYMWFSVIGVVFSCLRAGALALLFAAAFTGRSDASRPPGL